MSTLSSILNTGRRALQVQELAMQVLGHNIANVNTEGYSRQRVDFRSSPPGGIGQYNAGSGVDVGYLGRVRDRLLDEQILESQSQVSYWSRRNESLEYVEGILNGLGDENVDTRMQQFWSAWQDLANDPESESARMQLLQRAETLTSGIRSAHEGLTTQLNNANEQIYVEVNSLNQLTDQVASINVAITQAELGGAEASDLRDSRDLLIEQIGQIINVTTEEMPSGVVNVYSGGHVLVQIDKSVDVFATQVSGNSAQLPTIRHGIAGSEMEISQGSLKALLDLRDSDIMPALSDLDELANTLSARVNEVHRTGYGLDNANGFDFFESGSDGAANLRVNNLIVEDIGRIASASASGASGDNSIALAIAAIQQEKLMNNGRMTLDEFNRNISLRAGSSLAYAQSQFEIEDATQENLLNRRASISGVSIDEEMTRMIQVQKAYDAAAKIVTTTDSMINTLINMTA